MTVTINSLVSGGGTGGAAGPGVAAGGTAGQVLTKIDATNYNTTWTTVSGTGTVTSVAMSVPAAGLAVTGSPITTSGTLALTLANDLLALEGLTGTGIPKRTGVDTWSLGTVALGSDVSGNLPVTNLASGTGASSTTFWRGDGSWATPAGSGTVTATAGSLTSNAVVLGAGGTDVKVLASLGTTSTVLHGNAAGAPTFGAVALGTDVSGILAVANGGSGTATPAILAGTNIGVTGSWPAQTVAFSGILPVASGGTGTATPSIVAGSNVTVTGTWPNQTINSTAAGGGGGTVTATAGALTASALVVGNGGTDEKVLASLGTTTTVLHGNASGLPTFGAVALATDVSGLLPVANGGTGTASPGIVAGANVTVTGTWPNQTVAAGKPSILSVSATRDLAATDISNLLVCSTGTAAVALNVVSGLGTAGDVIFFKRAGANALTIAATTGTLIDTYTLQATAIPDDGEGFLQCKSAGVWIRYA